MPRTFSSTPLAPMGPNSRQSTGQFAGLKASLQGGLQMAIDTPGLDEQIDRLQKFAAIGTANNARVKTGMKTTMSVVKNAAMSSTVPVRSGNMKSAIFSSVWAEGNGDVEGHVGIKGGEKIVLIAMVLEGGRKAHASSTFHSNKKEDYFSKRPGGRMFRKVLGYGKVGAIIARRWLWHALSRNKGEVDLIWKQVLEQITNDLAGKG